MSFLALQIILMGKRELVGLLCLSTWCLVIIVVLWSVLKVTLVGLQCVIVIFPDHTCILFCSYLAEVERAEFFILFYSCFYVCTFCLCSGGSFLQCHLLVRDL